MNCTLQRKIKLALQLIENAARMAEAHGQILEIAYSGGKDSDCILELARMANVKYQAIYKNTTIDPPYTIAHCKANGVEIMQPRVRFFDLVKLKGIPTMRARFCCEYLKEYKINDYVVLGIRREESTKRAKNYKEPEMCRIYMGGEKVRQYFPILEWTANDVAEFVNERGIKCHPLYYDEKGMFHPERRLGCIGCPLRSDRGVSDFKKYPKFLAKLIQSADYFMKTHPDSSAVRKFENVYNLAYNDLFCDSYDEYVAAMRSLDLWGNTLDSKQYLQEYFKIKL